MKYKKLFSIVLLFFGFYVQTYSQLSGYYTIGGSGANYQTLPAALSDLYTQGMSGDVTFALNPGTYPGAIFTEIPGASYDNWFVLQSVTLDSTDVYIDGTIDFNVASYITIRALTITTANSRAIDFLRSWEIHIESCIINSSYQPGYNDATVYIKHYWDGQGGWSRITIDHCIVNSSSPCIYCTGNHGRTTINNCELNSSGEISIKAGTRRLNINNNLLNGGLAVSTSNDSNLRGNEINGKINIGGLDSVINNTFISNETIRVSSNYFKGNHFSQQPFRSSGSGSLSHSTFIDNYFGGSIHIPHATNIKMIGNIFLDDISLSFNKELLFENNMMYGELYYGDAATSNWNYRLHNNIFFNEYVLCRGHHSIISYNNFVDSAYLYVEYSDIMVHDNNFCRGIQGNRSPENISHNNYFPMIYCYYDTNSVHYDPGYFENNPGITTNLMLQGKGWSEAPEIDLLGNLRKDPPAIGANEIYVCSDSMNNIITVPCGEELYLNLCSLPDTGNFWWTPDSCILNPDTSYTAVIVYDNMTWYLYNSVYGLIDSVSTQVEPFNVEIAEMPIFYCGYARTLNASYHPYANYHWTPEDGLTNPYIRNPKLLIEDTTNLQYVLECQIDGCGVSYDTLNIDYDPSPHVGIYYPQQNADTVFFTCLSTCVDEYLWDFGDGSFSNEENPYHIYKNNGIYTITLTGTNYSGSDSHTVNYNFYWVSSQVDMENEKVQIFPNPANEKLFIRGLPYGNKTKILISSLSGSNLINTNTRSEETIIDIRGLKQGIYILQLKTELKVITKKIMVIH